MIEISGSRIWSVLTKFGRVSLVSKYTDVNLWRVYVCMVWVSFRQSSLPSISAIVVCVISWYVSGNYCSRLVVQVFIS